MICIVLVGVATGVDLENQGSDPELDNAVTFVTNLCLGIFTVECGAKIVAEGTSPLNYFTNKNNGWFNTFDFGIVVASFALMFSGATGGGAIGALRILRLVRLMTLVKGAPVLRVIVIGLIQGVKSVVYIIMLLFLVQYLFAIGAVLIFGLNDPAHFGTVRVGMISLLQISTLSSWSNIAYVSWWGCDNYLKSPYHDGEGLDGNPSIVRTSFGSFEGFKCKFAFLFA